MSGTNSDRIDGAVYVVQTLVDDNWTTYRKYTGFNQVETSFASLVDAWGQKRVRVLVGKFSDEKQRRVYSDITDAFALSQPGDDMPTEKTAKPLNLRELFRVHKFKIASSVLGVTTFAVLVLGYSSFAGNMPRTAAAAIEHPVDIREKFVTVIGMSYGRLNELATIPPRMQGRWSPDCKMAEAGHEFGPTILQMPGEAPVKLAGVLQKGQDYGLMLEDGTIMLLKMQGVDSLQLAGWLSSGGELQQAETASQVDLARCL